MTDDDLHRVQILRSTRTIAVVGMSPNPSRASHRVGGYLLEHDPPFDSVWFVNPSGGTILGQPVYPTLAELPGVPDLVDVFRRADVLPSVAREAVEIAGTRTVWMQLGLVSEEAARIAIDSGRQVVMDACLMVELERLRDQLV